ncbi:MAG: serine hydrolase [Bacteroidota bacterium]
MKLLKTSVPLWLVLVIVAGLGTGTFISICAFKDKKTQQDSLSTNNDCGIIRYRSSRHGEFTRPLLMADSPSESNEYLDLKSNIIEAINAATISGGVSSASVYFRDLNSGKWILINGNEKYSMASIMKLVTMMYHLHVDEIKPGWLNQKILVEKSLIGNNIQTEEGPQLILGKEYTVKELITFMIRYSNNNATAHLNSFIDFDDYKLFFSDIGLPVPDPKASDYTLSSDQCSRFLRLLFNSSILSNKNSEFALSLLSESVYHGGLLRNITEKNVKIAHKFGERFYQDANQLHETAIFYTNENPYLITVLTNGKDTAQEAALIGKIGSITFDYSKNKIQ